MRATRRRRALPILIPLALGAACLRAGAQAPPARSAAEQHAIAEQITTCTEDRRQFFASGLSRDAYRLFCNCYVYSAFDALDGDERAYRDAHGSAPSPGFVETSRRLVDLCLQEARTRAPQ